MTARWRIGPIGHINVFDTGLAWVLRRIANPIDKGSIPSRVSNFMQRHPAASVRYVLGMAVAEWLLQWQGRGHFASGFRVAMRQKRQPPWPPSNPRLVRLCLDHHRAAVDASTRASQLKDKLIEAQKALSAEKRKGAKP